MVDTLPFDDDAARWLERTYQTPDVVEQRMRVLEALDLGVGESVLDIGVGPGLLAFDIASLVGPSGRACGIDVSEAMVTMSKRRCEGLDQCELERGEATELPFGDGVFDAVVSTQVYEYVADMPKALAEAHRVLKKGGRVVILDTAWDSAVVHTSDPERHAAVMKAWDEHLVHPNLPATLSGLLREAGFGHIRSSAFAMFAPAYQPYSYAAGIISVIAGFVSGRGNVSEADAKAWHEDLQALGERGDFFFSVNRYLFTAIKSPE
jgi:ubiquinone/menaquinone biosynthesis C-methylase UbiE